MFCKYCGEIVSDKDVTCSKCGKEINREGGIGFWDMAKTPQTDVDTQQDRIDAQITVEKERKPIFKSYNGTILAISIALSAFCIALTCFSLNRSSKEMQDIIAKYEHLNSSNVIVEDKISRSEGQLSLSAEEIASLEKRVSALENPKVAVEVLSLPKDVTWELGYTYQDGEDWPVSFEIRGEAILFKWEKQTIEGFWQPVVFEGEYNINTELGLRKYENTITGQTAIVPYMLTEVAEGLYQCTAVTVRGNETVQVRITVNKTEPTEEPVQPDIVYATTDLGDIQASTNEGILDPYSLE